MWPHSILSLFPGAKPRRNKPDTWDVRCPVHDDQTPSAMLTISGGKAKLACMVCRHQMTRERFWAALLAATGTNAGYWFEDGERRTQRPRKDRGMLIEDIYPYYDAEKNLVMEIVRHRLDNGEKAFAARRQRREGDPPASSPADQWIWERPTLDLMDGCWLYHYPELLADQASPVFIVEGEKDCDYLGAIGLLAVTNPFGAGHWQDRHGEHLAGRRCVICEDNDVAGRRRSVVVAGTLIACEVPALRVLRFQGPEHFDVTDFLLKAICYNQLKPYQKAAEVFGDTAIEKKDGLRKLARDTLMRAVAKESFGYKYLTE